MNVNNTTLNNIVKKEELRKVQLKTLEIVSDAVMQSAGVHGSNTMIMRGNEFAAYSKDGKKIAENIKFVGQIENRIVDELFQIVDGVVKNVGDGTTSTIRLAYYIFKALYEIEDKDMKPFEIIRSFTVMAKKIAEEIEKRGRKCELEDIYKIALISTNGNKEVAREISQIYEDNGLNVYISVQSSTGSESMTKIYDGITLPKGFASPAFINTKGGKCIIHNPRIYIFEDGIDTEEMMGMFNRIMYDNIMLPYQNMFSKQQGKKVTGRTEFIPTVILTPRISSDAAKTLEDLETTLYAYDNANQIESKPPIAIITKLNRYVDDLSDISILCGVTPIRKYIDPSIQKNDIEAGKAPTIETVSDKFFGSTELIEITANQTSFINPKEIYVRDKDGNLELDENNNPKFSSAYNGLIGFLKSQLEGLENEPEQDIVSIRQVRRRISNLESNMVDYFVGGITVSEREALKDLVEDAVLNCRSAALNGVGYGANFMAYSVITELLEDDEYSDNWALQVLCKAYADMIKELYKTALNENDEDLAKELSRSLDMGMPLNLDTKSYDGMVLSSIMTDSVIITSIAKVITIMLTANQAIISDAIHNPYRKEI